MTTATKLDGWKTMTEDVRLAMGIDYAEPDYDEVQAAIRCGQDHYEIGGYLTSSGRPELITIPDDIAHSLA